MSTSGSRMHQNTIASESSFVPVRIRFDASDAAEKSDGTRLCIEEYLAVIGEIADLGIRSLVITGSALLRLMALERIITYAQQRGIQTAVNTAPGTSGVEMVIDDHGDVRRCSMDGVIGSVRCSSLGAILRNLPPPVARAQTRSPRPAVVVARPHPRQQRVPSLRLANTTPGRHRHTTV